MDKRQWYARLMLVIFIMVTTISVLHHHNDAAHPSISCSDCTQNIHHSGHFSQQTANIHDCLLCQFQALPYIAAANVTTFFQASYKLITLYNSGTSLATVTLYHSSPRAPPVI